MPDPSTASVPKRFRVIAAVGAVTALACFVIGAARFASWPMDGLVVNVVIDDAFYYLVPARYLLAGQGYAFDGEHLSSGVQPLWALLCVGLTALITDPDLLVRALMLLGAGLWATAGLLIGHHLLRVSPAWAVLATAFWLVTGFWQRVAFQGMENGLHACLFSLLLIHLTTPPQRKLDTPPRKWLLTSGTLLALFTLTRLDGGIFALIVGGLVAVRVLPLGDAARTWGAAIRNLLVLAAPGIILVGGWLVCSYVYFGELTPLSGAVKRWYQAERGYPYDSLAAATAAQLRVIWEQAAFPIRQWSDSGPPVLLSGLILGGLRLAVHLWQRTRQACGAPLRAFTLGFAVVLFALLRLMMFAALLPSFTIYGTWYFAPEAFVATLLLTGAVAGLLLLAGDLVRLVARSREAATTITTLLATLLTLIVVAQNYGPLKAQTHPRHADNHFYRAATWLEANLPAGARVAAGSAGVLAYFAPSHTIINVDGLMNDREFFESYLKTGRAGQPYFEKEQIRFFADYGIPAAHRNFVAADRTLLRWWPLNGQDPTNPGFLSYAIWQLPTAGGDRPASGAAFERYAFQAAIERSYPLISADTALPAAHVVVTSLPVPQAPHLLHVAIPSADAAAATLSPAAFVADVRPHIVVDETWELSGYSRTPGTWQRGRWIHVEWYWRKLRDFDRGGPTRLQLALRHPDGTTHILWNSSGCHDTWPLAEWPIDHITAESFRAKVPRELASGQYAFIARVATGSPSASGQADVARSLTPPSGVWFFLENVNLQ